MGNLDIPGWACPKCWCQGYETLRPCWIHEHDGAEVEPLIPLPDEPFGGSVVYPPGTIQLDVSSFQKMLNDEPDVYWT